MRATVKLEGFAQATQLLDTPAKRALTRRLLDDDAVETAFREAAEERFGKVRKARKPWLKEKAREGLSQDRFRASGVTYDAIVRRTGPAAHAVKFQADRLGVRFGVPGGRGPLFHVVVQARGYSTRRGRSAPRRVIVVTPRVREVGAETALRKLGLPATTS